MRILYLITLSELGGAQTVVAQLANALCDTHEIIVAAGDGDGKLFEVLDERIKIERIPHLVRRLSPSQDFRALFSLRKLYKKYNPDIIHLHSSKIGILGRLILPKNKTIYTVHGFDSIRLAYRKYLMVEKLLQSRTSAIVGVSKYDSRNLCLEGIVNNVSTVYNGIDTPLIPKRNIFSEYDGFEKKVLCIARISKQKNPHLFIQVAKLLPQYAFIWIGNQNEIREELPKNVFFMGNIVNAGQQIINADLFYLPTNYEGLPMVIIEALSVGVPVVASNVGGISEMLDGTNGFAIENSAELHANKINTILTNEILYDKMSNAAIQTYKNLFTIQNMVSGYLSIYNSINNK